MSTPHPRIEATLASAKASGRTVTDRYIGADGSRYYRLDNFSILKSTPGGRSLGLLSSVDWQALIGGATRG